MGRRTRGRASVGARSLSSMYELGEIIGEIVAEATLAIGEAIAEAVGAVTGLLQGGMVRVEEEESVDGPVVLVVNADSSDVKVHDSPLGMIKVAGYRSPGGEVRVKVEEREGKNIAWVVAEAASVRIEAPLKAVGVIADSSSVRIEAGGRPLEYLSVKTDSSGIKAGVALARGGGIYAKLDSSAVKVYATPIEDGEYWVDVDSDSSGFTAEISGDKTYEIEEEMLNSTRLVVERTAGREARVKVKVKVKADASVIRLL